MEAIHSDNDPTASALLDAYCDEKESDGKESWQHADLRKTAVGRDILAVDPHFQVNILLLALERYELLSNRDPSRDKLRKLVGALFARKLAFGESSLAILFTPQIHSYSFWLDDRLETVIAHIEAHGVSDTVMRLVIPHLDSLRQSRLDPKMHRLVDRIKEVAGIIREGEWDDSESWVSAIRTTLEAIEPSTCDHWYALFALGTRAEATKPANSWLRLAARHVDAIGHDAFARELVAWISIVARPTQTALTDRNSLILRGLVWSCISIDSALLSRAIGDLAEAMFRGTPNIGPRSRKVGNACLYALSMIPGAEPLIQLSRLSLRLKGTQVQRDIEKALQVVAQRTGMTRDELIEITVPTYGLDPDGELRQSFGDATAEIAITGTTSTEWRWTVNGKSHKSAPKSVRANHADGLRQLKATEREIQKTLAAQRDRLEQLFLADRSWDIATWRARYLDHPLLAYLVRRLIWEFRAANAESILGIYEKDQMIDVQGKSIEPFPDGTRVRLWHPISANADMVLAWRTFLEDRQIVQPFKQAHREIYVLTDAERVTETYSNRFAGHIIRQPQFIALGAQRGWTYQAQGWFDLIYDGFAARALPVWNMRTQYWVDRLGDECTPSGLNVYLSTDQVRFCALDGTPLPLSDVPALAFSEIMRDVDLFVGVTSIGNDPTWQDRGAEIRYNTYWHAYAFGDLTVSARQRGEMLTRLLPKLKIASQCMLRERFLEVRGTIRTYKIHLGSGNILMEPNDQYLCIVPDRRGEGGNVFLPFEGDATLSLILSKAFLLADDTHITDPTILRQIRPQ